MKSKLAQSITSIKENLEVYRCPLCHSPFTFKAPGSICCITGHQFDIAKPGYLFLLSHQLKTKYDHSLFTARHETATSGFFQGMIEKVAEWLKNNMSNASFVLDTGTGEGSILAAIIQQSGLTASVMGIDIAKDGIKQAARDFPDYLWTVADLANCPLKDSSVDVLVNILSPANYDEFKRVLKKQGYFIKVIPETNYLTELRALIYPEDNNSYSNEKVRDRLIADFNIVQEKRITYKHTLTKKEVLRLLEMTPLGWHFDKTQYFDKEISQISEVTVDYKLIIAVAK